MKRFRRLQRAGRKENLYGLQDVKLPEIALLVSLPEDEDKRREMLEFLSELLMNDVDSDTNDTV